MESGIDKGPRIGMRHVQALMLFLCVVCNQIGKQCIIVTIAAMNSNWQSGQRAYVLKSYFWAFIITVIPSALITRRYGAKKMLFLATISTGILSLVTPGLVSCGGWKCLVTLRGLQGIFQSCIPSAISEHIGNWSPKNEINRIGGFTFAATDIGNFSTVVIGIIGSTQLGWQAIYYLIAVVCCLWSLIWLIIGANNASSSLKISTAERDYIESTAKAESRAKNKKPPIPWLAILTSSPILVLFLARIGQNWLFGMTRHHLPIYLEHIMKFDINETSLYVAIASLVGFFTSLLCIILAEQILSHGCLNPKSIRRMFNTLATVLPAVGCAVIGFIAVYDTINIIFCLILIIAGSSPNVLGSLLNIFDLTVNHLGIVMAINSFVCAFTLGIIPYFTELIIENVDNRQKWQMIFIITALSITICNIFFAIFMSVDIQEWDDVDYKSSNPRTRNQ